MSDSFANPWIVACQAPLAMGFHRQECWSRLPFPSPENLPNLGMKLHLLCLLHWQADSLPVCHMRSPRTMTLSVKKKKKKAGWVGGGEAPCNPSGPRLTDHLQYKVSMIALISFSVKRFKSWQRKLLVSIPVSGGCDFSLLINCNTTRETEKYRFTWWPGKKDIINSQQSLSHKYLFYSKHDDDKSKMFIWFLLVRKLNICHC